MHLIQPKSAEHGFEHRVPDRVRETERPSTLEVTQLKCGPLLVVENNAEEDRQKQNWQQRAEDNDHQQRANFHKVWSLAVAGQCRIGNPTSERKVWVILNSSRTGIFQRIKGGNQHNCPLDHHVGLERHKLSVDADFDFLDLYGFVFTRFCSAEYWG